MSGEGASLAESMLSALGNAEEERSHTPVADVDVDDVAERAERVRVRRDMLQQEVEIEALEQQLATLRRRRDAGFTPGGSDPNDDGDAESQAPSARSSHGHRGLTNRPRLREPDTFKGKTLKEARDFIRSLELVFALAPDAYQHDRERVLYGVMFLAGEPRETWHHGHSVDQLDGYLWDDFKRFVLDAVEDPVNRTLSTIVAYETARQGDHQSVQAFAAELATLEEQMEPYTPVQRTRHLLAKLKPALRTGIITYHEVPQRREDLVSLATRLESAERKAVGALAPHKRPIDEQHEKRGSKKRRGGSSADSRSELRPERKENAGAAHASVVCYGCNETGHYKSACPNPQKWQRDKTTTRKVGAVAEQAKQKRPAGEKGQE
jgi:hypothetical protein